MFNAEHFLVEALESLLSQTFSDFELLLFDDGSTDRTLEIASLFASRDSRISIQGGKHCGYVHWLNSGLKIAKGELIARMDADDISIGDRLEKQVRFLDEHPDCCVVGAQAQRIDSGGFPISLWRVPETHDEIDIRHVEGRPGGIIHPSVMMRMSVLRQVGGYRAEFEPAEDYDLFLRMAETGRVANLPEVLLRYRVHEGCVTFTRAEAQSRGTQKALEEAWARRGRIGVVPKPSNAHKRQCAEDLGWSWARTAFAARNFETSRRQALGLLRRRPTALKHWALFGAASIALILKYLRTVCVGVRRAVWESKSGIV